MAAGTPVKYDICGDIIPPPPRGPPPTREQYESPKVAWDLCNTFLIRLSAGIEVAICRIDYYLDRTRSHKRKLEAADDFVKLFGVDVAFHTDMEDYSEAVLLDVYRVSAARDSLDDLLDSEARDREVSMKSVVPTLFRCPGKQREGEAVRWLRRNSSVWLSPPYAFSCDTQWAEKAVAARARMQRRLSPRARSQTTSLERGYASDSALLEWERARRTHQSGAAPPEGGAGPSSAAAEQPAGGAQQVPGRRVTFSSDVSGAAAAADPVQTEVARLKNLYYPTRQRDARTASGSGPAGLLAELWALHAATRDALHAHARWLAVLTARSEGRAWQLCLGHWEVPHVERLLLADVRAAARAATAELSRCRRLLRARAADAANVASLLARLNPTGWWRLRSEAQLPATARLSDWWQRVWGQPGGTRHYTLITREQPLRE